LTILPVRVLSKAAQINPAIYYYHMVSDDENVQHVKNLYTYKNIQGFKKDIEFLLKNFEPISLFNLLEALEGKRQIKKGSFLLTFDDGFNEMYDIVRPILLEKGISATFFVNSDFVDNKTICYQHKVSVIIEHIKNNTVHETKLIDIQKVLLENKLGHDLSGIRYQQRHIVHEVSRILEIDFDRYLSERKPYLTSVQIKELVKDGFTIGAHSIDHPLYENLTLAEQLRQTIESVKFVKTMFSLNYGAFAFPHKDTGVSKQFFTEIYKKGLVDVSFGTGGLMLDVIPKNFQRVSLENPPKPAEYTVARSSLKNVYCNLIGKKQISRLEN
jgi:peptidoglycan/xylan/chitin deacetylase (PgdA/CDA1 family)